MRTFCVRASFTDTHLFILFLMFPALECVHSFQVYKLPADRFYATYFGGDKESGLVADNEARDIWLRFLPPERVLPFGCKVSSYCLFLFLVNDKLLVPHVLKYMVDYDNAYVGACFLLICVILTDSLCN